LANSIVSVGRRMKTKVVVLITDMEQPLGRAIGNALEIRECIDFLKGTAPQDLEMLSIALAAQMIRLAGRAKSIQVANRLASDAISTGAAASRFRSIIRSQGGNEQVVDDPDLLPRTRFIEEFRSRYRGFVTRCDAKLLGTAANMLGAGRGHVDDVIDPAVGLYLERKAGDPVEPGDVLCRIHWNDQERFHTAMKLINQAFQVGARRPKPRPLIHAVLEG